MQVNYVDLQPCNRFTRAQAKLTRAGLGIDMPLFIPVLHLTTIALETRHMLACVYFKRWIMAHSFLTLG